MIFDAMAKSPPGEGTKIGRNASTGRYVTVGRTSDGVTVLKSSKPGTHFSARQARGAITSRSEPTKRK